MSEPRKPGSVVAFFGALLMAVGALIAALSGLCTAIFLVAVLQDAARRGSLADGLSALGIAAPVGGIPIAVGVGLFFLGRNLVHRGLPSERAAPDAGRGPEPPS